MTASIWAKGASINKRRRRNSCLPIFARFRIAAASLARTTHLRPRYPRLDSTVPVHYVGLVDDLSHFNPDDSSHRSSRHSTALQLGALRTSGQIAREKESRAAAILPHHTPGTKQSELRPHRCIRCCPEGSATLWTDDRRGARRAIHILRTPRPTDRPCRRRAMRVGGLEGATPATSYVTCAVVAFASSCVIYIGTVY